MSKSKNLDDIINEQIEKVTGKKPLIFDPKKLGEEIEGRKSFEDAMRRGEMEKAMRMYGVGSMPDYERFTNET